jgi:RNA polymerase sigma factor (sigma-70 family)
MEPETTRHQPGYIPDETLIAEAVDGNRKSLEQLLKRHQDYVYNISLRLFLDPDDALDATQEVLIKVVTSLKTFAGQSQFRTWLYRIAVNHFLNTPARQTETVWVRRPESTGEQVADMPEPDVSESEIEEVRLLCSTAMLLCLTREQRLLYIIGEIFGADHQLGAALFETSAGNYRVKLHRAKTDLLNYVSGKCGLVDARNPCRCPKKARQLVAQGIVDGQTMRFNRDYQQKISQLVVNRKNEVSDEIQLTMLDLFQDSPFQIRNELDLLLTGIVA